MEEVRRKLNKESGYQRQLLSRKRKSWFRKKIAEHQRRHF